MKMTFDLKLKIPFEANQIFFFSYQESIETNRELNLSILLEVYSFRFDFNIRDWMLKSWNIDFLEKLRSKKKLKKRLKWCSKKNRLSRSFLKSFLDRSFHDDDDDKFSDRFVAKTKCISSTANLTERSWNLLQWI